MAWGLASRVVSQERIREEAVKVAQEIAAQKPVSVRQAKHLLALDRGDLATRLEAERSRFVEQIATEEARQGIIGFLER